MCRERNHASQLNILNYYYYYYLLFLTWCICPEWYGNGTRSTVFTHGAPCRRNEAVSSDLSMKSAVEDTAMQPSPHLRSFLMVSPLLLPPLSTIFLSRPVFFDSSREIELNYRMCSFKSRKYPCLN